MLFCTAPPAAARSRIPAAPLLPERLAVTVGITVLPVRPATEMPTLPLRSAWFWLTFTEPAAVTEIPTLSLSSAWLPVTVAPAVAPAMVIPCPWLRRTTLSATAGTPPASEMPWDPASSMRLLRAVISTAAPRASMEMPIEAVCCTTLSSMFMAPPAVTAIPVEVGPPPLTSFPVTAMSLPALEASPATPMRTPPSRFPSR